MALVMCAVVIAGQNYQAYLGHVDLMGLLTSYIGLPLFLALWAGHRIVTGAPRVDPATADLSRSCVLGLSSRGVSVPHHSRFPLDSGSGPISSPIQESRGMVVTSPTSGLRQRPPAARTGR